MHPNLIHPDLVLQATVEFLASIPERKLGRVLVIPGAGNHSNGPRAGIQSCIVVSLLAIINVPVERLEGMISYIKIIRHICSKNTVIKN